MTLPAYREGVLRHARPARVLQLTDKYLLDMESKGSDFILPREHAALRPALERFYGELPAWLVFVAGVRDELPRGSDKHRDVQSFYRTLTVRLAQQQRRERLDAAVTAAVTLGIIEGTVDAKLAYSRRCTQVWSRRRSELLNSLRKATKTGRLSVAEREEALNGFWRRITGEIAVGDLPAPKGR